LTDEDEEILDRIWAEPGPAPTLKDATIAALRLPDDELELLIKRLIMVRDERLAKIVENTEKARKLGEELMAEEAEK
jgi:hypothetical protein